MTDPATPALGDFLRSRRARIRPEDVGLPQYGRRRVPGLRREEVAQLAGVSVDYYVRLEQGRGPSVSDAVLDAVARVLRLDDTERGHLYALARPRGPRAASGEVRPGLRTLLDSMAGTPAFVLGRRMEPLAWNGLADAVNDFSGRIGPYGSVARHVFLAPDAREFYAEWAEVAAETAAYLRLDAGRHPGDARLEALVAELSAADATFRALWSAHDVKEKTHGRKRLNHPVAGALDLGYETFAPPGDPDRLLVTYAAPPGSPEAEKLALLASWWAGRHDPAGGAPGPGKPIPSATEA